MNTNLSKDILSLVILYNNVHKRYYRMFKRKVLVKEVINFYTANLQVNELLDTSKKFIISKLLDIFFQRNFFLNKA